MKQHIWFLFFIGLFLNSCTRESDQSLDVLSGSYATMLPIGDRLYVVNKKEITTFDISNPALPISIDRKDVGDDIQSLYYYQGLLIIGSANDMFIYQINKQGIPERQSSTNYNVAFGAESCTLDPIVVRNDIAYVTLTTRLTSCFGRYVNQLNVYDITNILNPKRLHTINMAAPKGLGFGQNHLFVCDYNVGLVIFNLDDPIKPERVNTIYDFGFYDLIIDGTKMVVVSEKELLQFDISDEQDPVLLSKIAL